MLNKFLLISIAFASTSCSSLPDDQPPCYDPGYCIDAHSDQVQLIMNRTDWTPDAMSEWQTDFWTTPLGFCIYNATKGERPDVACYIPQQIITFHLSHFYVNGGSSWIDAYCAGNETQNLFEEICADGWWIAPYNDAMEIYTRCIPESCPVDCIHDAVGIPRVYGHCDRFTSTPDFGINRGIQTHVFREYLDDLNIRMPDGNDGTTIDGYWRPGGFTSGGTREAVVDGYYAGDYCWNAVGDAGDGVWCYPNCDIVCNGAPSCNETNCDYFNDPNI